MWLWYVTQKLSKAILPFNPYGDTKLCSKGREPCNTSLMITSSNHTDQRPIYQDFMMECWNDTLGLVGALLLMGFKWGKLHPCILGNQPLWHCVQENGTTSLWCHFPLSPPSPYCVSPSTTESQVSESLGHISTCRAVIWLLAKPCCLLAGATAFISFGNLLPYHKQLCKIKIHTVTIWFSDRLQSKAVERLEMVKKHFFRIWTVSKLLLTQPRACLDEKRMCSGPCPMVPSND